jgi:NYN domain
MMACAQEDDGAPPQRIAVLIDVQWFIRAAASALGRADWHGPELHGLVDLLRDTFAEPRPDGVRVVRSAEAPPGPSGTIAETRWYDATPNKGRVKGFEGKLSSLDIKPLIRELKNRPAVVHPKLHRPIEQWFSDVLARVREHTDDEDADELADAVVASVVGIAQDDPEMRSLRRDPARLAARARERFVDRMKASRATMQVQKGVDVQLALDVYARAERGTADHVVLASGDGDLAPAFKLGRSAARKGGRSVGMWLLIPEAFSNEASSRLPGVADDLIEAADGQVLLSRNKIASIFPGRRAESKGAR